MTAECEIWAGDLLNRHEDATFAERFLTNRISQRILRGQVGSYVLNLDAGWGEGKTFFMTRLQRQLVEDGHIAVYVNAWQDDHADDPLLAVMSAIDETISPFLARQKLLQKTWDVAKSAGVEIAVASAKNVLLTAGRKIVGQGVEEITEIVARATTDPVRADLENAVKDAIDAGVSAVLDRAAQKALEEFRNEQRSINTFRHQLDKLLQQIGQSNKAKLPIFVLVDELDRCRPTYAIKLLERIKHLFDVSNVAFVLATDSAQLRHSIKAVYGGTFDSAAYLRRFFDRTYRFEPPKVAAFVADQASRHGIQADIFELPEQNDLQKFLVDGVEFFDLSLRDIEQCFDLLSTVAAVWSSGHKIQIAYLFPLVVAFQQSDDNLFDLLLHRDSARLSQYWRSRRPSWTITLFESDGYRKRPVAVDFLTYISELLGQLSIALPDLAGRDASSHISRTVFQMYMQEYQVLHHGVHYSGNPKPTSVLRSYPELVRNAGRITLPV